MPLSDEIPAGPGAYALLLHLAKPRQVSIGRLGEFLFQPGEYAYLGSACGPGGLHARLGRHLGPPPIRTHWHIDYLRWVAEVSAVYWTQCATHFESASHIKTIECLWSQTLANLPEAYVPVPSFGASDCKSGCAAHLVAFSTSPSQPRLMSTVIYTVLVNVLEHSQLQGVIFVANWVGDSDERHMTWEANSATINKV